MTRSPTLPPLYLVALLACAALACTVYNGAIVQALPTQPPTEAAATLTPSPSTWPTNTPGADLARRCVVTAKALNVRAGPGLSWAAVAWLRTGEAITTTRTANTWLQVPGLGWIISNFVECEP